MIGFLEIRRRKLQFALVGLIVTLISFLVLMINGLGVGLNEQAGRALRNFDADAIAYSDRAGLSVIRSELSAETVERIGEESGARESAPLGYMAVNYRRDDGRVKSAAVLGFDPGSIGEPPVRAGRALTADDVNGLLADRQFLRASGLKVGDTVRLSVRLQEREFTIVGELNEGAFFFQPSVYMLRSTWREMKYGMVTENTPSASIVLLKGEGLAGKRGTGWEAVSKSTAFANIEGVAGQQSTVQALRVFGYLIGGLVVGVFFYVLTLQKTPQIGVLKAVGASTGFIFRQLLVQALLVALGGVVIAVPLAWLTNEAIKQAPDPVPIAFTTGTFVTTSVLLLLMAVVGVLFSGRQVAKVDPIIALGQQQ
ncbi:MAG: ABC transporter permease [Tepidiforma sp.]|nr:MAG: ABC transporter permease [Tepidiforma sp.]